MPTLYRPRPLRLTDQDLSRITFWVGMMSAAAFTSACAAVLWSAVAA